MPIAHCALHIAHISSSVQPTYSPEMRVWENNTTEFFPKSDNELLAGIVGCVCVAVQKQAIA